MLYEGNKSYYPLILIGQNVKIGPGVSDTVGCLCVSPSGRVAIVEQDPSATGETDSAFLERMTAYSDLLRSWDWEHLDEIAADYYYRTEGQAFRVIDLMARAGYLVFADQGLLSIKMDRGLKTETHLVIVSTDAASTRKADFSCGDFADSSLFFACVDSNQSIPFLPK